MKKNILLFGNYGGQNWGDEAILSGMLAALPLDIFRITVVSANPKQTENSFGVRAVFPPAFGLRSFFRFDSSIKKAIQSADIIIFGGGGLLQNREKKAIFLWTYYVWYSIFFHKKNILFAANSVGPLHGILARLLAKWVLTKVRFFSVRDVASARLLQDLGFPKKKLSLATDAIFLKRKKIFRGKREGTLLAIRGDGAFSLAKIKKIIPFLPQPVRAIAMDNIDTAFAQKMKVSLVHLDDIDDVYNAFASAAIVLTSRLHGALLSLHNETPFVALCAAPKVKHFLRERGLSDLLVSETISSKKLLHTIQTVYEQQSNWRNILSTVRRKEVSLAKHIFPAFLR